MAANRIVVQTRRGSPGSQAELEAAQPQLVTPSDLNALNQAEIEQQKLIMARMQILILVRIAEALGVQNPVPTMEEILDNDVISLVTNTLA